MKKKISIITAALLLFTLILSLTVSAAGDISVFVTISDENGKTVLALAKVAVSDFDGDGILTVSDALYSAHESFYDGGAKAGYACSESEYGLSLDKLWGCENGGSYGYYVNNVSAYSLTDPLSEGDCLRAFAYTDLEAWSDLYSYFSGGEAMECAVGEDVVLTLNAQSYDADWNAIVSPFAGAVIRVNGEDTPVVTDDDGNAQLRFDAPGEYLVSARSDESILVPPVCVVTVSQAK